MGNSQKKFDFDKKRYYIGLKERVAEKSDELCESFLFTFLEEQRKM